MSRVTSKRRRRLSPRKRLALFGQMMERIDQLPPVKPAALGEPRGWTREDLYDDRLKEYARFRRH